MSYLEFMEQSVPEGRKTKIWNVANRVGIVLGKIAWWPAWRKYTFHSLEGTFDAGCLREIADFCENRTEEHGL